LALHIGQEIADDLELLVARKIERFLALPGLVFFHRELGVVLDDVGEAVAGEDLLPEVGALVAVGIHRIAFALAVGESLVEGNEVGRFAIHLRRHPHFIRIHGEVDEAALELEQGLLRVAVVAVLLPGVVDVLACPRVLEFQRRERQTVEENHHVDRLLIHRGKVNLPRDGKHVALELGRHFGIQLVVGQSIEQIKVGVVHLQSLLQDSQYPILLQLAVEAFENLPFPIRLVVEFGEFGGLGRFEELPELRFVDREFGVEVGRLAAEVAFAGVAFA